LIIGIFAVRDNHVEHVCCAPKEDDDECIAARSSVDRSKGEAGHPSR
jgi:hypothetical protein